MSHESQLLDLVVEWEDLRAAGQDPSLEELCSDCPGLVEELRECLAMMASVDAVLRGDESPRGREADFSGSVVGLSSDAARVPRADWPVIPQYEILEELGHGGMGVVFKARHVTLGRTVALKTILPRGTVDEDQVRRFIQEAKLMALLQHPNIVQIYEIGQQDEHPFLVMEYVPGKSLSASLKGKPWSPRKAADLVAVLARAVQVAHEHGVIHRDLKPNNILLTADGTPKICDFGLAKHFEGDNDHTKTGQLMGTPSYMAPEQVLNNASSHGPAVDIHALGVVLYETLTGRPPFLADNPLDTLQLVIHQEPVPPRQSQPKIPVDLETICLKCLAKEPERRYASAAELADDLGRFLADEPVRARRTGLIRRSRRWCRAHPTRAALILAAVLAAVIFLGMITAYNRRLAVELDRTEVARQETLTVQQKLHHSLMRQVADDVDGDLRQLASVPLTMASLLDDIRDGNEARLANVVKDVLEKTPLVFGTCVAFEPFEWQKDRENFALYVFRKDGRLVVTQLVPPAYQPLYRQWDWYRRAKENPQGRWSEPYIDAGGGQIPMVTFSAPILRDGRFVGVVTADLSIDYFRQLRQSIEQLDWGPQSYCFLVSAGGRLLVHPIDRYEFPGPDSTLAKLRVDERFRALVDRWSRDPAGTARALDFSTGRPATFTFSRIPVADWTLVNVAY